MANEMKQYNSHPHLLKKFAATAGITNHVNELCEAMEECFSAGGQPGDSIIDNDSQYQPKTSAGFRICSQIVQTEPCWDKVLALPITW
jgi:hypothetical protein